MRHRRVWYTLDVTELPTKGARTRVALLEAAIERFARDGYRATSVAEIARAAHLSSTAAYVYFPNKEALFIAAVDEDAAGVVNAGIGLILDADRSQKWREDLLRTLLDALDDHPLARRVLGGLEPEFTVRLLDIPVLAELRKVVCRPARGAAARGRHPRRHRSRSHGGRRAHDRAVDVDVAHPDRARSDRAAGRRCARGVRRRARAAAGRLGATVVSVRNRSGRCRMPVCRLLRVHSTGPARS